MPTDDELRDRLIDVIEDTHRAHLAKRFNGEYVPCECEGDGGDSYFDHLNKMLLDAASPLMAEAVAAEWERCARIAAEHEYTSHEALGTSPSEWGQGWNDASKAIAAAIRADREPEPATEATRTCPENEYCDPHTCRVCSTSPIHEPRPCANCGERIIWLDAMWMHDTGELYCPGGMATPAPTTEEGSNRD